VVKLLLCLATQEAVAGAAVRTAAAAGAHMAAAGIPVAAEAATVRPVPRSALSSV